MLEKEIQKFLLALDEIVSLQVQGITWREKREAINNACTEQDANNLFEFLSWFDTGDAP